MIQPVLDALLAARERLARRSHGEILAALEELIEGWLEPQSRWRSEAEEALGAETGLSAAMLRDGLRRQLEPLGGGAIARLLEEELGAEPRGDGPRLVVHVLPGNVPALAASAICLSLAVRASALVKPASEERCFAPLFARTLVEVDADLAACVAVRYWPGGEREIEDAVFARADVVDASGSDESIEALRARVRGRFIGRGSRLSFAAVGREVASQPGLLAAAAAALAEDVAIWEQRGCLSPQVVLVETTSPGCLERVAAALLAALDERAQRWPPSVLTLEEKAVVARFVHAAEWGLNGEDEARLVHGSGGTLVVEVGARRSAAHGGAEHRPGEAPPRHAARSAALQDASERRLAPHSRLRPTCLHRTVRVQGIADLAGLPESVGLSRVRVEAVGLAVGADRFADVSRMLRAAGVIRVCPAGEMQRPDLSWKPGGLPRLRGWMA